MKSNDMISTKRQELIGDCINHWDQFYKSNYSWIYKCSLELCGNTLTAKTLAEKFMTKVILTNPEIVVNNDIEACKAKMAIIFPYLGNGVDRKKEVSAGRLLNIFYTPN